MNMDYPQEFTDVSDITIEYSRKQTLITKNSSPHCLVNLRHSYWHNRQLKLSKPLKGKYLNEKMKIFEKRGKKSCIF